MQCGLRKVCEVCKKCGLEGAGECELQYKLERVHKALHEWYMSGRVHRLCTKVKVPVGEGVQVASMAQVQRAQEGCTGQGDLPQ